MENQKPALKEILTCVVFIIIIGALFALNIVIPAPKVLVSERRVPAKLPTPSGKTMLSGDFMKKFDSYAADRFVFRDTFRGIYSIMIYDVYMQTDKSGLYRSNSVGAGEFQRVNATAFRQTSEKIKKAAESLDGNNMRIYYSIIPDKSIFAGRFMPGFDIGNAEEILFDTLHEYTYIPLINELSADSFYKTDLHWDQSKINGVADFILSNMGNIGYTQSRNIFSEVKAGEFQGVYAGQLALPIGADTMVYNDISGLSVRYLNEKTLEFESGTLYDTARLNGVDPYDLFLRGPQPLIVIENDSAPERELYLFRDSFGSSLAPLLACSYSKTTIIDLRYINLSLLEQFIEFKPGSDVLFIYGSQIFNNPSILQT